MYGLLFEFPERHSTIFAMGETVKTNSRENKLPRTSLTVFRWFIPVIRKMRRVYTDSIQCNRSNVIVMGCAAQQDKLLIENWSIHRDMLSMATYGFCCLHLIDQIFRAIFALVVKLSRVLSFNNCVSTFRGWINVLIVEKSF